MRTVVISDIHGMLDLFKKTLRMVDYNHLEDKLILLGDYLDRGSKSYETVEYIIQLQKEGDVVALLGNHEDMAITAQTSREGHSLWIYNGGTETVKSYRDNNETVGKHIKWFESLPLFYETDKFFFCHAGVNPYVPLDEQSAENLLWIREDFYRSRKLFEKTIVFGHTPFNAGYYRGSNNILGIDGGAVFCNKMTALIIKDGEVEDIIIVNGQEN